MTNKRQYPQRTVEIHIVVDEYSNGFVASVYLGNELVYETKPLKSEREALDVAFRKSPAQLNQMQVS